MYFVLNFNLTELKNAKTFYFDGIKKNPKLKAQYAKYRWKGTTLVADYKEMSKL